MKIARLNTTSAEFETKLAQLLRWDMDTGAEASVEATVQEILRRVRDQGDSAVLEYTQRFDNLAADDMNALTLSRRDLDEALARVTSEQRLALDRAADRIREYHQHQVESSWSYTDALGNRLGQNIIPLERVGFYVPGGRASYPSSVLMSLLPARVAGAGELIVTVPTPGGARNDMVLAALSIAQADCVFTVGGAQAIGAMAFGTQTVPRVDKIVGPGNAYVAAAKRQVFGHVGIDVIAGPSEILILADGSTDPHWVALDLFSQAEHDAAAQSILLSPDADFVQAVASEMVKLLPSMPRREIIEASLRNRGALIVTRDLAEAVELTNLIAPEHLELQVAAPDALVGQIRHAGAIFCGAHAAETFGDYAAGPSHVLPTFGTARFASPLGVYDFVKRSSVINLSPQGAAELAEVVVPLASSEGLHAHSQAAFVRARPRKGD